MESCAPAEEPGRPLIVPVSSRLPDFPWDKLSAYAETARAHPEGIVDLFLAEVRSRCARHDAAHAALDTGAGLEVALLTQLTAARILE